MASSTAGSASAAGLAPADEAFARRLADLIPAERLAQPEPRHLEEPRGRWRGKGGVLVRPRSTEEVASVIVACGAARVGVVPYGGGTGLVGGQVLQDGPAPVILSLERMAAIREFRAEEYVMIAEAGAVLADVQAAAAAEGLLFPLSLASEGSARIGGLLATNAGGAGVLRYGNARDLCLGVEAVMPDGSIFHGARRLRKDNTGFDIRNLLIGSEGALGVITAASLRLFPRPAREGAALIAVESPAAALRLLALAQRHAAGAVSAFELIHRQGFDFLRETMPELRLPFSEPPEWMVLVDLGLAAAMDPTEVLGAIFAEAFDAGLAGDGVIAQTEAQRAQFWAVREAIPEANRRIGAVSSHDISLPLGEVAQFIARAPQVLAPIGEFRINCFGHLGDGNLHYNVFPPPGRSRAEFEHARDDIKRGIHDLVHELGGSVSAEHGIGRLKVADLERYSDPAKLAAMRAVKAALDPLGIMNPGAVIDARGR